MDNPDLVILAGPNGADKTTVGLRLIKDQLAFPHFVNADDIVRPREAKAYTPN